MTLGAQIAGCRFLTRPEVRKVRRSLTESCFLKILSPCSPDGRGREDIDSSRLAWSTYGVAGQAGHIVRDQVEKHKTCMPFLA